MLVHVVRILPDALAALTGVAMPAVPKRLRDSVLKRDQYRCRYCGRGWADGVLLTVDHVRPRAQGGTDAFDNCVAACHTCNSKKGARWVQPPSGAPDHAKN